MNIQRPQVGVGVLLLKGNKILLCRRKGSHGEGEWGGVGGHLEGLESFEDGILRELAEEAGPDLRLKNLRFLCVTNFRAHAPKHYVDIGMVAEWKSGKPLVMEPDRIEGEWLWRDLDDLPTPLFGVLANYVEAYRTGKVYFAAA
jgi:8-oxo-dGTP diphosphatase